MKSQAPSLKVWIVVFICFFISQYLSCLYFEEKIFYPRDSTSLADGHFYNLEQDFKNTAPEELKVAVLGSSRVAKGIECPDKIRNILAEKGSPAMQLNKIWESYDPFKIFIEHNKFFKRLTPLKPDLICLQAEMLAIKMGVGKEVQNMTIEKKHKRLWNLEYKGNPHKYISKKLKYQSKIDQELIHTILNGSLLEQGKKPCSIYDHYVNIDTLDNESYRGDVMKMEEAQYAFPDLKILKEAGIKVVIIDVPFPVKKEKARRTPKYLEKLQTIKEFYKHEFDIDYWEYTGTPLYYKYYADAGHLNSEGRKIYTEWLLEKIHKEMQIH